MIRVYPPTLPPQFMGAHPPSKLDTSSSDATSVNYFQKYRIDTLAKFSMPRYEWGMEGSQYSPEPDIIGTKRIRNINRDLLVISNDISTIDLARMREVDELYKGGPNKWDQLNIALLLCEKSPHDKVVQFRQGIQINRCQYKDRTGTLHPLTYFEPNSYNYQCAPGMTVSYLAKYPASYVGYKIPIVLPTKRKQIPNTPNLSLSGIYDKSSCIAYKR